MTRLEKARLAMEEADKRAQERKKDYEALIKAEEEKIDRAVLGIVKRWAKNLPEKTDWHDVPERLEKVLQGRGIMMIGEETDDDDNDINS